MSLDLNKLENKLDEALSNETTETLTKFLNDKRMKNNKQQTNKTQEKFTYTTEELEEMKEWEPTLMDGLEDIGTTIAQPKPKKVVGWYCLSTKVMVNTIAFATHSKPNFIKRFFMRTLLDFYWIKDTNYDKQ
jgi:hypothetical protein